MKNQHQLVLLHLSLIDGVGPGAIARITKSLASGSLESLYDMSHSDLVRLVGLETVANKLYTGLSNRTALEKELLYIEQSGVSWITLNDSAYPELLKNSIYPPPVLYWQGSLPKDIPLIAVVGSRDGDPYGKRAVDQLVAPLVQYGWGIASGGAIGIDAMAHEAALAAGGVTIAILGSGLLRPYPHSNKQLFDAIVESGGAIISSFSLTFGPLPGNFPARNRVIAGMSKGCVVVQAAIQSGARITAQYCLQEGREVFAVPGPIDDELSAGCHALIQQGAKLITNVKDILVEFGQEIDQADQTTAQGKLAQTVINGPAPLGLDPVHAGIVAHCAQACSIDELMEATGIPLIQLSQLLFELQLKGLVMQNMAGLWQKR
jgi:DNA processing protein